MRAASCGISSVVMVTHEESKPTEETEKKQVRSIGSILPSLRPSPLSSAYRTRSQSTTDSTIRPKIITWRSLAVWNEGGRSDIARFISMINPTSLKRKKERKREMVNEGME